MHIPALASFPTTEKTKINNTYLQLEQAATISACVHPNDVPAWLYAAQSTREKRPRAERRAWSVIRGAGIASSWNVARTGACLPTYLLTYPSKLIYFFVLASTHLPSSPKKNKLFTNTTRQIEKLFISFFPPSPSVRHRLPGTAALRWQAVAPPSPLSIQDDRRRRAWGESCAMGFLWAGGGDEPAGSGERAVAVAVGRGLLVLAPRRRGGW